MDEVALREKAREVIRTGTMPRGHPDRTWGGPGDGADCTICRAPVQRNELELELEFARNDNDPGLKSYHVHIRCFAAWDMERTTSTGEGLP